MTIIAVIIKTDEIQGNQNETVWAIDLRPTLLRANLKTLIIRAIRNTWENQGSDGDFPAKADGGFHHIESSSFPILLLLIFISLAWFSSGIQAEWLRPPRVWWGTSADSTALLLASQSEYFFHLLIFLYFIFCILVFLYFLYIFVFLHFCIFVLGADTARQESVVHKPPDFLLWFY